MKRRKIESYMGLARRAGRIVSGYQTCLHIAGRGDIKLMIVAADASEKTKSRFRNLCCRYGVEFRIFGTVDELSAMTGYSGRGIYGITDSNFAEVMIKEIQNEKLISEE